MQIPKKHKPFVKSKARYCVSIGGAGSGKSYAAAGKAIIGALAGRHVLVIRKVAVDINKSVWPLIIELLRDGNIPFHSNKSERTIYFDIGKISFIGLDDPERLKSIHGVDECWVEEASELEQEDWRQLTLRLRGKTGGKKQYYLTYNPININHWSKAEFFDNPPDDCETYHSTYLDNPFLDAEYIATIEALKNRDWYYYTVYALGEWGEINNSLIFHNYKVHDFDILDKALYLGADWGYNDPTALIGCYIYDSELYIVNEYYERGKTNSDLLVDWVDFRGTHIIADSSEPARIREFQNAGFRISAAEKGQGSVKAGIDYLRGFKTIHIHRERCPNVAREFALYKYKETKTGIIDDPLDMDNHSIDAIRYSLETIWNKKRRDVVIPWKRNVG